MKKFGKSVAASLLAAMAVTSVSAQELSPVGAAKDWAVYQDPGNAKHCYVISTPTASKALRDGAEVSVKRGDIRLYVGVKNGAPEPAFLAGYPLATDRAVEVKIGGDVFNYFVNPNANPEYAWPNPNNDQNLIATMKRGAAMEVTAMSQRGTQTVDVFSLSGFTAAFNKASEVCGN